MANKAKTTGKNGVDRWTGNGQGITMGKRNLTPEQAREIDNAASKKKQNRKKK